MLRCHTCPWPVTAGCPWASSIAHECPIRLCLPYIYHGMLTLLGCLQMRLRWRTWRPWTRRRICVCWRSTVWGSAQSAHACCACSRCCSRRRPRAGSPPSKSAASCAGLRPCLCLPICACAACEAEAELEQIAASGCTPGTLEVSCQTCSVIALMIHPSPSLLW